MAIQIPNGEFHLFLQHLAAFFEKTLSDFPNVKFIQGISQKDIENRETWQCSDNQVSICVCDDLADNALKNEAFARLFTVYGHHWRIINISITQNPFFNGLLRLL